MKQAKISRDFQTAILGYQNAARASAEKQRLHVERARQAIDSGDSAQAVDAALSPGGSGGAQLQQLQQQQLDLVPDSELEYQEQVIQEREGEIRDIESGILELNEIFRDLGTIVTEQQSMLGVCPQAVSSDQLLSGLTGYILPADNIESNVISVANDTQGASEELVSAHNYQRKAGRRMLWLFLIFIVVLAIVLLAVSLDVASVSD